MGEVVGGVPCHLLLSPTLSQNCTVAWDRPGKACRREQSQSPNSLHQPWTGLGSARMEGALWAFQNDPDTPMGTAMCGQPGMTVNQCVIRLCVFIHAYNMNSFKVQFIYRAIHRMCWYHTAIFLLMGNLTFLWRPHTLHSTFTFLQTPGVVM